VYVDERKLLEKKKKALSEESAKLQEIVKEKEKVIISLISFQSTGNTSE
jgi:hypothetical protein